MLSVCLIAVCVLCVCMGECVKVPPGLQGLGSRPVVPEGGLWESAGDVSVKGLELFPAESPPGIEEVWQAD